MVYHVEITATAVSDIEQHVDFIRRVNQEPEAADRWLRGLVAAIDSLKRLPRRCVLIPEADEFPFELRQRLFYSHRIVFQINEKTKTVIVLRLYHGSRKRLSPQHV